MNGPPLYIQLQALTQARLLNAKEAYIIAFIVDRFGAELHEFKIKRHEKAEEKIIKAVSDFWHDIKDNHEPDLD